MMYILDDCLCHQPLLLGLYGNFILKLKSDVDIPVQFSVIGFLLACSE